VPRVVAVGEQARVAGFALAGADVVVAEDGESVRSALAAVDADPGVAVVLLTPSAAAALVTAEAAPGADTASDVVPGRPLRVVMPP
jgi:vacuolar-type H+-ATPase subunit F/Vma7